MSTKRTTNTTAGIAVWGALRLPQEFDVWLHDPHFGVIFKRKKPLVSTTWFEADKNSRTIAEMVLVH